MAKLNGFITRRVQYVKQTANQTALRQQFDKAAVYYKKWGVSYVWFNEKQKFI